MFADACGGRVQFSLVPVSLGGGRAGSMRGHFAEHPHPGGGAERRDERDHIAVAERVRDGGGNSVAEDVATVAPQARSRRDAESVVRSFGALRDRSDLHIRCPSDRVGRSGGAQCRTPRALCVGLSFAIGQHRVRTLLPRGHRLSRTQTDAGLLPDG